MPTIQAGQSATIQLMEGETVTVTPVRQAQVSTRGVSGSPLADPRTISAATTFGPYTEAGVLVIGAIGDSVAYANTSPVSQDGILPRADTEFPAERVAMAASGCACASPCQIERIRCVTGTSVALTVYDNPAVSSGTTLYSGTLSAGQEAAITTPIRAINGVRAVFASGSFDVYVSQDL